MHGTQSAIIYDCLCQISDGDQFLSQLINLAIVKSTHPDLYHLYIGHNNAAGVHDRNLLCAHLFKVSNDRSIKLLESLKGQEIPANITVNQLLQEIDLLSKQVSLNLVEVSSVKDKIKKTIVQLNNNIQRYQTLVDKYCQECLIPVKLKYDRLIVNLIAAQLHEIFYSNRLVKVRKVYETYGSVTDIEKLKEKRRKLEKVSEDLITKITETKSRLNLYNRCDDRLINEYLKVKEQLDEQKWAKSMLGNNLSNLSISD